MRYRRLIANVQLPAPALIKGFGDSIVMGLNATLPANRFLNIIGASLGLTVQNHGISGTLLQRNNPIWEDNGVQRYLTTLRTGSKYDWLIIQYGLNDLRHASGFVSLDGFKKQYAQVLEGLIRWGQIPDRIVLGSPPWMDPSQYPVGSYNAGSVAKHMQYRDAVAEQSDLYQTRYVDIYEAMKTHSNPLSLVDTDGIHPNNPGHQFLADQYIPVMAA